MLLCSPRKASSQILLGPYENCLSHAKSDAIIKVSYLVLGGMS